MSLINVHARLDDLTENTGVPANGPPNRVIRRDEGLTQTVLRHAAQVAAERDAQAILVCGGTVPDCSLIEFQNRLKIILLLTGQSETNEENEYRCVIRVANMPPTRTSQVRMGLLLSLSRGLLKPRDQVVCVSGMADSQILDTVIVMCVGDEFDMFLGPNRDEWESSDLRPDVLQRVLELTTELAVEGREGNAIGTFFVIGDIPNVLLKSHQMVLNPFHGYPPDRRNILDRTLLGETAKEFSTIDGAFLVHGDGTIESAGTHIDSSLSRNEQFPHGLGARHRAAAAITAVTNSIAVTLSQSTGTVTVFRKGRIVAEMPKPSGMWPRRTKLNAHASAHAERLLVVGGGIAGLSIAWRLAETGLPVTVLEASALGAGVTTRNQGWLRSGALFAPGSPELAAAAYSSLQRTLEFCSECVESQTSRMLYLFTEPESRIYHWIDAWRTSGIPCEPVSMPEVARELPGIAIHKIQMAFRMPDRSIRFDVLLNQLAVIARVAGVDIQTETPVVKLVVRGETVRGILTKAGDEIPARFVILAAGAGTESLLSTVTSGGSVDAERLSMFKSHLIAMRPRISRVPFCIVDQNGFNHLPHGDVSVLHANHWIPASGPADQVVAPEEIEKIQRIVATMFPGQPQGDPDCVEWADTTVQSVSAENGLPGKATRPRVIAHESLRNLVSAFPGRATLWPLLADRTRQIVLANLNTAPATAPPWMTLQARR